MDAAWQMQCFSFFQAWTGTRIAKCPARDCARAQCALCTLYLSATRALRYMKWFKDIREEPESNSSEHKEALALKCAISGSAQLRSCAPGAFAPSLVLLPICAVRCCTGVAIAHDIENGSNSTHKSWMFHIISYILPFFIASRGNLWRYSSAKLESRGGRVKRVARAVVCWQPRGVYTRTIKRSRKGGAEASNRKTIRVQNTNCGSKNILDRLVLAENLMRARET